MSDLITRLRSRCRDVRKTDTITCDIEWDAADRIEELEAENAKLREALLVSGYLLGRMSDER